MPLYHDVANEDELLDGMVDLVFAQIEAPATDGDWQAAMRQRSLSAREVLLRHSWAIALMESRTHPGPANRHHRDAVTGCLRTAEELAAMGDDVFLPLLPPAQYPHLNEVASALLAAGYDPAAEFTFGLAVILAALDRVRSASGT